LIYLDLNRNKHLYVNFFLLLGLWVLDNARDVAAKRLEEILVILLRLQSHQYYCFLAAFLQRAHGMIV